MVSAVPDAKYKVKTEWLKDGCVCLNVAADKNFEKDIRDKVRLDAYLKTCLSDSANSIGISLHPGCRESHDTYASS